MTGIRDPSPIIRRQLAILLNALNAKKLVPSKGFTDEGPNALAVLDRAIVSLSTKRSFALGKAGSSWAGGLRAWHAWRDVALRAELGGAAATTLHHVRLAIKRLSREAAAADKRVFALRLIAEHSDELASCFPTRYDSGFREGRNSPEILFDEEVEKDKGKTFELVVVAESRFLSGIPAKPFETTAW